MNTNNILYEGGLKKAFNQCEPFCEFSICIKILYALLEKIIVDSTFSIEVIELTSNFSNLFKDR